MRRYATAGCDVSGTTSSRASLRGLTGRWAMALVTG